jgi:hypothetical protein
VVRSLGQQPEFDGGIAARLSLADGRWVFLKGLPADAVQIGEYRAEARISSELPEAAPVSPLLATVDGEWLVLVFADVDGTHPRLRPGSPELSRVLTTMGALARTLTPCPLADVPEALEDLGPLLRGWREIKRDPPSDLDEWSSRNLDSLAAMETSWHPWAHGDTLLHNNLHPESFVVYGPGQVRVVNWRYPVRGAAWLDLVSLAPHLLVAGHEPRDVDKLINQRPVLAEVPAWAVTAFGVALAGHAERTSRLPDTPRKPGIRAQQAQLASATRAWIKRRTRWT